MENDIDFKLSPSGDLILDDHEILYTSAIDLFKQQVQIRIKTMTPDWFFDKIGSNLEELLGEPNIKKTAEKGINLIRDCLTRDGFIDNSNIFIKPMPTSLDTIAYFIFIKTDLSDKPLGFEVNIALSAGINLKEV